MIKLVVLDPDPQFAEEIERLLEERNDIVITALAQDINRAMTVAEQQQPHVMIIGPGIGEDVSVMFVKKLTAEHPVGCILFTINSTARLKTAAIRSNVVEVIQVPAEPEKIIAAIKMAAGFAEQLAIREEPVEKEKRCATVTVFSTKGGVGKTVLSINMGAYMAGLGEGRVVLVDLDLQFGDVGIAMGMHPEKTILDLVEDMVETGEVNIEDFLVEHKSGLKVLMAPKNPESADLITGEHISAIMSALKKYADFIIVDTPASFNDNVLAVLDRTDEICIVLNMDMPSVKNIKLCLRTLNELRYAREKQRIVVNRVENNVGLKVIEIEKVLGMRAIAKVPSDKAVPLSVNKGVPVVMDAPKLPIAKEIEELSLFYVDKYQPEWVAEDIEASV